MPLLKTEEGSTVVPVWINGEAAPLNPSQLIPVHSTTQEKIIHYAQGADVDLAKKAAETAGEAFASWKKTSYTYRRDLLLRVADIYQALIDELIKYQCEETNCQESYARFNVNLAIKIIKETASAIATSLTGEIPPIEGEAPCFVFKEAVGPVLVIPPWNSSIILGTRSVVSPLAAGCTIVLKASELCPRTHHAMVEAFTEAGLPAGVLNQVQARREDASAVTEALIGHKAIRKVEFIGSAGIGRIIGGMCSKYLKPILMELGGKGPVLVLHDANLEQAAKKCAQGAFLHHGQICFSTERIIVEKKVADRFRECLIQVAETEYPAGSGAAVSKSIASHAHDLLEDAKANGATFIAGDNAYLDNTKTSLRPTIVTNVDKS